MLIDESIFVRSNAILSDQNVCQYSVCLNISLFWNKVILFQLKKVLRSRWSNKQILLDQMLFFSDHIIDDYPYHWPWFKTQGGASQNVWWWILKIFQFKVTLLYNLLTKCPHSKFQDIPIVLLWISKVAFTENVEKKQIPKSGSITVLRQGTE